MNNYNLLFNIAILFGFFSCSKPLPPTSNVNTDIVNVEHTVELPDLKDSKEIYYSELFSKVRYIELDSHPSQAIIGSIAGTEITNDGDIVILDQRNCKIIRYDSCGHFLNLIGDRGHGPNEFIQPKSICYDKYDNQILVLDSWSGKVLFYSLDGKMAKSISVAYPDGIRVVDSKHRLLFYNYFPECLDHNFLICTNDGEECCRFDPVPDSFKSKQHPATNFVFSNTEDDALLCRAGYSSIIYKVKGSKVSAFIELTSKEKIWSFGRTEKLMTAYENRNKTSIGQFHFVNDKFCIQGFNIEDGFLFEYWSDFKGMTRGGRKMVNDIDGLIAKVGGNVACHGKEIYKGYTSIDIEEIFESWKGNNNVSQKERDFVTKMSNNINPFFQVCTVKD